MKGRITWPYSWRLKSPRNRSAIDQMKLAISEKLPNCLGVSFTCTVGFSFVRDRAEGPRSESCSAGVRCDMAASLTQSAFPRLTHSVTGI